MNAWGARFARVKALFERIQERFRRREEKAILSWNDTSFCVHARGKLVAQVDWAEVLEIVAWKEDLFTYDIICLGFRVREDGAYWQINEEFDGYSEFHTELNRRFPEIKPDWVMDVAFPAFARNRMTLWRRGQRSCN